MLADQFANLIIENKGVQAVGTVQEEVPVVQELGREIGMAVWLHADGASQLAPLRAGHGLALQHQAQLDRDGRGDVILGQAEDLLLADQVGATVAHVGDVGNAVADDGDDEGRGHRLPLILAQRSVVHAGTGGEKHAPEGPRRVEPRRGLAEHVQRRVNRQPAGDLTFGQSTDAVGQQGDAALLLAHQRILGFPELDRVLVDRADGSGSGQAGVAQAHRVGKNRSSAALKGKRSRG